MIYTLCMEQTYGNQYYSLYLILLDLCILFKIENTFSYVTHFVLFSAVERILRVCDADIGYSILVN